jgi:predicted nuclease of predicted toxin-antitoxin system
VRLLIDNALSPAVSRILSDIGHDCVHVRDRGLQSAPDGSILSLAEAENRTIVSADTDFGALLAIRNKRRPSFILLRKTQGLRPSDIAMQVGELVIGYQQELEQGCVLTVGDTRVRIRNLPIE